MANDLSGLLALLRPKMAQQDPWAANLTPEQEARARQLQESGQYDMATPAGIQAMRAAVTPGNPYNQFTPSTGQPLGNEGRFNPWSGPQSNEGLFNPWSGPTPFQPMTGDKPFWGSEGGAPQSPYWDDIGGQVFNDPDSGVAPGTRLVNGQWVSPDLKLKDGRYYKSGGNPDELRAQPAYAGGIVDELLKTGDLRQGPDGEWFTSTVAEAELSKLIGTADHGWLDAILTRMPMIAGAAITGGALAGAFPGVGAAGNVIPAGQSGILSQLGQSGFNFSGSGGTDSLFGGTGADTLGGLGGEGSSLFDWGGGLAEDAGLSMNDWIAQQVGAGGGDLGSLFGTPNLGGLELADMARTLAEKVGPSAAKSVLGKFLSGEGDIGDYMKLLGSLGSAGLGYLGANQQSNALTDISNKYLAMGAPYRSRLNASYEPGFDLAKQDSAYQGAMDQSAQSVLRGLSASTGGNPFDNPGAMLEANRYVTATTALPQLNTYRSQLGTFGQLGTNIAGTADMGAANASGGGLNSLGYGLGQLTNPTSSLDELMRKYGLNTGKTL